MHKHLLSFDEETTDIIREIPEKKKSAWVQDAVKQKKRIESEPENAKMTIPTVRIRL